MRLQTITFLLFLTLAAAFMTGCEKPQPYVSMPRLDKGLVVVLPGIEGRSRLNENICEGLDEGGVNWAIEIDDWTAAGFNPLFNLRAEGRNRKVARRVAKRIEKYQLEYPNRPVVIVGHSGGGAMAIWIAEELQPSTTIRGLILINASISRKYDLREAFERTSGGIVNFYSPEDYILLGAGTTIFATMDGKHGVSAGMKGFIIPQIPDDKTIAELYAKKLFQIAWDQRIEFQTGHSGGHFSSSDSNFVARYVAPFVMSEYWTKRLVQDVKRYDMRRTYGSPRDLYENTIRDDCGLEKE